MSASSDLHNEHVAVSKMIKILEGMRAHLREANDPPAGDWADVLEFLRVFVDRCHHGKEEQWLFPALREVADVETRGLVERLLSDHKVGRTHVAALAEAVERRVDCPRAVEAIEGYVAMLRPHIIAEETALFPEADRILAKEIQQALERGYERIERDVIGPGRHEAFHAMLHGLTERYVEG
jgi:hemerythrin-like domain-containing protein